MTAVHTLHKLVEFFSNFTVLPVDPDDVAAQILSYGVKDEIFFVGVDLDKRVMLGAFHQYIVRKSGTYSESLISVDIYFDRSLPRKWKRLVCTKELLHVLGGSVSKTASVHDFENLLNQIVTTHPPGGVIIPPR